MKQELLKWIDENKIGRPSVFGLGTVETVYMDDLIEMINGLDEPQITDEQAWNKIAEVYPETAQNLRITLDHAVYGHEAEPQKVKVPAIIYMWLYYCKGNNYALKAALDEGNMRSYQRATGREGLQKWFESKENQDLFSKAWSNGYEEEEQKYYIKLMDKPVDKHENYLVYEIEEDRYFLDHPSRNNSRYQMHFTEDEIKAIDERYWPFAVPVEKV